MNKRVGEVNVNKYGSKMVVVEYNNYNNIFVKFEQGKPVHTQWNLFSNGNVKHAYDRSIFSVGYIGEGKYKPSENSVYTSHYKIWHRMIQRCYSEKLQEKYPSYINCTVSDDWHNFQNFAKWYDENYYEVEGQRMCLDKDILIKGNKIYSPDKCIFVPSNINLLFTKSEATRGDLPIGVSFNKISKKYYANCSNGEGKWKYLGFYTTPEEAFYAYKIYKEKLIKSIAEKYKIIIPSKLYDALLSYEVNIND